MNGSPVRKNPSRVVALPRRKRRWQRHRGWPDIDSGRNRNLGKFQGRPLGAVYHPGSHLHRLPDRDNIPGRPCSVLYLSRLSMHHGALAPHLSGVNVFHLLPTSLWRRLDRSQYTSCRIHRSIRTAGCRLSMLGLRTFRNQVPVGKTGLADP